MTPEQMTLATGLVAGLDKIGTLPIGTLLALIVIGPWVLSLVLSYHSQKRFEAMAAMYEKNIELVENYKELAEKLTDLITLGIQVQTRLVEKIDSNMFCPIVREKGSK